MKRSEINARIVDVKAFVSGQNYALPPWAYWSMDMWGKAPEIARHCKQRQMGWGITDFGSNDFDHRGLVIFCTRNGLLNQIGEMPYAEKILIAKGGQETPTHTHKAKQEDLIVRGGGNLVVEMFATNENGERTNENVTVTSDGLDITIPSGVPLVLEPGESVTMPRGVYHRFYGEVGGNSVLVGEVSQAHDDTQDNYFLDADVNFPGIDEDEVILHPLWSDLPG